MELANLSQTSVMVFIEGKDPAHQGGTIPWLCVRVQNAEHRRACIYVSLFDGACEEAAALSPCCLDLHHGIITEGDQQKSTRHHFFPHPLSLGKGHMHLRLTLNSLCIQG